MSQINFNIVEKEINWGGKTLSLKTGKIARQADGAVLAQYGETVVLATVVCATKAKEGIDFLPLTVQYIEKAFAAGKIPGGFFKREGRQSEKEILVSRLIDRPLRPLFPSNFHNETQVIITVLSHDQENDPDILALVATGAATAISGAPISNTLAGVKVGYIGGEYILNPTIQEMAESELELIIGGTKDSVLMVESEAKELSEEIMLGAVNFGHEQMQPVLKMIEEFTAESGKEKRVVEKADHSDLKKKISAAFKTKFVKAYDVKDKQQRSTLLSELKSEIVEKFVNEETEELIVSSIAKSLEKDIVRSQILDTNKRIDDRDPTMVRPISIDIGLLPKTHGSALFTRGETQAFAVATLGTSEDEQIMDSLEGEYKERFLLHYNFPPYSVGEAMPLRAPGRREIGHGKLAWRAMHPIIPSKAEFPYTLRIVSEITESNGSSSMATVCATSLACMDAGIPMKKPVAGIAMGLIKEADKFVVLTDILGDEDYLGDMDFKVAGTADGITALQMDIKIDGITSEIMSQALTQANDGRMHILGEMAKVIEAPKESLNKNAPAITTILIDKDKIRDVIGSGGKVIREICETSGAKVDIEEDGTVRIAATSGESGDIAKNMILDIVVEPVVGTVYSGKITKITDFGVFVNFIGKKEGLVHISEIADERVEDINEIYKVENEVFVYLYDIERTGKMKLSIRAVDQDSGEVFEDFTPKSSSSSNRPSSKGGGNRRDNRKNTNKKPSGEKSNPEKNEPGERREKRKYFFS